MSTESNIFVYETRMCIDGVHEDELIGRWFDNAHFNFPIDKG